MATGTLGQAALSGITNTTVYTVPAGKTATFSVTLLNRGGGPLTARLAISSTGTPTNAEYIEYDASISQNSVLERTGLVASAGKQIVAYSSTNDLVVNVYGYED